MVIINTTISQQELKKLSKNIFDNFIKAVVDIEKEIIALDAELHSDLEALLLNEGSKQANLWGINLYPELQGDDFIEFDSMINMRPGQGNRSRGVDNPAIREKIINVVNKRIKR